MWYHLLMIVLCELRFCIYCILSLLYLKMQELENEKDKLKREVERLMKSIAATTNFGDNGGQVSPAAKEFLGKRQTFCQALFSMELAVTSCLIWQSCQTTCLNVLHG